MVVDELAEDREKAEVDVVRQGFTICSLIFVESELYEDKEWCYTYLSCTSSDHVTHLCVECIQLNSLGRK